MFRHGLRGLGCLALALAAPLASCASIAGIGGFEVDPCFDGCDGGPAPDSGDRPDAITDSTAPDVPATDARADAGPCACPAGTVPMNNSCLATAKDPSPYLSCAAPLQVPDDCAITLVFSVCDSDPKFPYAAACAGDAGVTDRASVFLRLGSASTGKNKAVIKGAYNVARPRTACDLGDSPCAAGNAAGTTSFSTPALPNNDLLVFGKRDSGNTCDEITVEVAPSE